MNYKSIHKFIQNIDCKYDLHDLQHLYKFLSCVLVIILALAI